MPELSRFFGVIIRMSMEAGGPHHLPHFHAYFQDDVAVIGLEPIAPLESVEMHHPLFRVCQFQIVGPFILQVGFDDGTEQLIDFEPVLRGELFGPLSDLALFNQVAIDPEVHTLVWPNGADFDPATLHDWPEYAEVLAVRAKSWEAQPV